MRKTLTCVQAPKDSRIKAGGDVVEDTVVYYVRVPVTNEKFDPFFAGASFCL